MFIGYWEIGLFHQLTMYKPLKIAVIILCLQLFSLTAHAVGECLSSKMDISEDMQKIVQKLVIKYGTSPTAGHQVGFNKYEVDEIYDDQELKVDRSQPFLDQVNAVGIITDAPLGANIGYASAVLISPCHILTNAHAITQEKARKGLTPVYVSLGQNTCESKNEFLHQDMPGKVIAIGNHIINKEETLVAEDYAIVRIKNISDVKPVIVATKYMSLDDSLMMIGFPHRFTYTQKTGLRYPTANFLKMKKSIIDGTFTTSTTLSNEGSSGSGIFALDKDDQGKAKVFLTGINQSAGGRGIETAEIVIRLAKNNPKALDEVTRAIENGSCN